MAEAKSVNIDLLHLYLCILPCLICYLSSMVCNIIAEVELRASRKSSQVRYHKGFQPKHQYRYHWFKARMKRKKKKRFRKPKPLFHLTWRGRALIAVILLAIRVQSIYNSTILFLQRLP